LGGIAHSIWYDWRDGGGNRTKREEMFGTVRDVYNGTAAEPFERKPSYTAALMYASVYFRAELSASSQDYKRQIPKLWLWQMVED